MGMFSTMKFDSLEDLFEEQLKDLYDAEKRLVDALPKMADAASDSQLKRAFKEHLKETKQQVSRLEQVFQIAGKSAGRETCEAMKGLIEEGEEVVKAKGDASVKDAALIAAAQRVEHYEIAGYGTARTLAQQLGMDEAAQLLQETLDEEGNADHLLTEIAGSVNLQAAQTA